MNGFLIHIHRIHDKIQFFLSFYNKQIEIQRQNFPNVEKPEKMYFRRIARPSRLKNILYNNVITAAHGYHFQRWLVSRYEKKTTLALFMSRIQMLL